MDTNLCYPNEYLYFESLFPFDDEKIVDDLIINYIPQYKLKKTQQNQSLKKKTHNYYEINKKSNIIPFFKNDFRLVQIEFVYKLQEKKNQNIVGYNVEYFKDVLQNIVLKGVIIDQKFEYNNFQRPRFDIKFDNNFTLTNINLNKSDIGKQFRIFKYYDIRYINFIKELKLILWSKQLYNDFNFNMTYDNKYEIIDSKKIYIGDYIQLNKLNYIVFDFIGPNIILYQLMVKNKKYYININKIIKNISLNSNYSITLHYSNYIKYLKKILSGIFKNNNYIDNKQYGINILNKCNYIENKENIIIIKIQIFFDKYVRCINGRYTLGVMRIKFLNLKKYSNVLENCPVIFLYPENVDHRSLIKIFIHIFGPYLKPFMFFDIFKKKNILMQLKIDSAAADSPERCQWCDSCIGNFVCELCLQETPFKLVEIKKKEKKKKIIIIIIIIIIIMTIIIVIIIMIIWSKKI